jgi:tetratricopeptide (TPR) repeat protein
MIKIRNFKLFSFLLLTSLIAWFLLAKVTSFNSSSYIRESKNKPQNQENTSQILKSAEEQVKNNPDDIALLLNLAEQYIVQANSKKDAQSLIKSLQVYQHVLDLSPTQADALLGMARVSLGVGVFDKAKDYYNKYLTERPEDNRARADLALTLSQIGEVDAAISELETLTKKEPDDFYFQTTLALAYKTKGNRQKAFETGKIALELAPDLEGRRILETFLRKLEIVANDNEVRKTNIASMESDVEDISSFFKNHEIIGPKIVNILQPITGELVVEVKDFPIQSMPAFARSSLESKIEKLLESSKKIKKIALSDAATNNELLVVTKK